MHAQQVCPAAWEQVRTLRKENAALKREVAELREALAVAQRVGGHSGGARAGSGAGAGAGASTGDGDAGMRGGDLSAGGLEPSGSPADLSGETLHSWERLASMLLSTGNGGGGVGMGGGDAGPPSREALSSWERLAGLLITEGGNGSPDAAMDGHGGGMAGDPAEEAGLAVSDGAHEDELTAAQKAQRWERLVGVLMRDLNPGPDSNM